MKVFHALKFLCQVKRIALDKQHCPDLRRKSFELWNPGWEVRALDEKILPDVLGDYCKQFTAVCKAQKRRQIDVD